MRRVSFHRIDQVRDQVGPALVLVFDVGPLAGHTLTAGHQSVISAFQPKKDPQYDHDDDREDPHAFFHSVSKIYVSREATVRAPRS